MAASEKDATKLLSQLWRCHIADQDLHVGGNTMKHALHSHYSAGESGVASRVHRAMRQFPTRFPARHLSTALATIAVMAILPAPASEAQPWMNPALAPEARAALLVGAMTLDQKEEQLAGTVPGILPELP